MRFLLLAPNVNGVVMWFKKNDSVPKTLDSREYDYCLKRISELNTKIESYANKLEILQTGLSSLRGKFNSRITGEPEKKAETEKDISSDELYLG
jgi:hypothetical protein